MAFRHIDVSPISGALGAVIEGVDLSKPLPKPVFDEIRSAWLEYCVIFFRGQKLEPSQFVRFARKWGGIHLHPFLEPHPEHKEIIEIIKTEKDTYTFGDAWHSDQLFQRRPAKATMLYAKEVPEFGGDTLFANMYLAYDGLSSGMKKILDDVRIEASGGTRSAQAATQNKGSMNSKAPPKNLSTSCFHPLFRTHPETGKKSLFIGNQVEGLKNFAREEAQPIIEYLRDFAERPEFTCRFRWEVDSLAFWDNRCVQHYAVPDTDGKRRHMHRITIKGDVPV
ncbi:MAG: taurine dioxygenase [Rhodospirillaceae bacterium]|nr:taurine dioxygenase [Rhodospirillaceae bacterium]